MLFAFHTAKNLVLLPANQKIYTICQVISLSLSLFLSLTMSPHNRINHQTKRREPPTSNGTRLRTLLRLHRRPGNASANHGIPHVVLPPILLHQALRSAEHSRNERELSAPVQGLIGRGAHGRTHLFLQWGLGDLLPLDDGNGRGHVGECTHEYAH